jgi:hypothetical protein
LRDTPCPWDLLVYGIGSVSYGTLIRHSIQSCVEGHALPHLRHDCTSGLLLLACSSRPALPGSSSPFPPLPSALLRGGCLFSSPTFRSHCRTRTPARLSTEPRCRARMQHTQHSALRTSRLQSSLPSLSSHFASLPLPPPPLVKTCPTNQMAASSLTAIDLGS